MVSWFKTCYSTRFLLWDNGHYIFYLLLVRSRLLLDNMGNRAGRAASRAARVENVVLEDAGVDADPSVN